jgi:hypothetical protein
MFKGSLSNKFYETRGIPYARKGNKIYFIYGVFIFTLLTVIYFTYNWLKCMMTGKKRDLGGDNSDEDEEN